MLQFLTIYWGCDPAITDLVFIFDFFFLCKFFPDNTCTLSGLTAIWELEIFTLEIKTILFYHCVNPSDFYAVCMNSSHESFILLAIAWFAARAGKWSRRKHSSAEWKEKVVLVGAQLSPASCMFWVRGSAFVLRTRFCMPNVKWLYVFCFLFWRFRVEKVIELSLLNPTYSLCEFTFMSPRFMHKRCIRYSFLLTNLAISSV